MLCVPLLSYHLTSWHILQGVFNYYSLLKALKYLFLKPHSLATNYTLSCIVQSVNKPEIWKLSLNFPTFKFFNSLTFYLLYILYISHHFCMVTIIVFRVSPDLTLKGHPANLFCFQAYSFKCILDSELSKIFLTYKPNCANVLLKITRQRMKSQHRTAYKATQATMQWPLPDCRALSQAGTIFSHTTLLPE